MLDILNDLKESSCSCDVCKSMCRRPCWPTPEDAEKLIDSGYSDKLMLDWYGTPENTIFILSPSNPGYEGKRAPAAPIAPEEATPSNMFFMLMEMEKLNSGCVFHIDGLCSLHEKGLKPTEGKLAHHSNRHISELHEAMANTWDNDAGRAIVEKWKKERGIE